MRQASATAAPSYNETQTQLERQGERERRAASAELRLLAPEGDSVEQVAEEIRALSQRTLLVYAYSVGRLVVTTFYPDDPSGWRTRAPKDAPLRRLAERLDELGTMSRATLHRCLATYNLLCDHEGVSTWRHVGLSHVRTVLPLNDHEAEIKLLGEAEDQAWTVRRLQDRVDKIRRPQSRPPTVSVLRHVRRLSSLVADTERAVVAPAACSNLSAEEREEAFAELLRVREVLEHLQPLLSPKRRP